MRQGPNHIFWKLGRLEAGLSDSRPIFPCTFLQGARRPPILIPFPLLEKPDGPAQRWALPPEMICKFWHQLSGPLPSQAWMPLPATHSSSQRHWQDPTCSLFFLGLLSSTSTLKRLHGKGWSVQTGPISQDQRVHAPARPSQPLLPQESGFTADWLCGPACTPICP